MHRPDFTATPASLLEMTITRTTLAVLGLFFLPLLATLLLALAAGRPHWRDTRWDSAGLAPDPATTNEAVVQIMAARTWGWKAPFAVHSWIVMKPEGATSYDRYDVVGWGVASGGSAVRRNMRPPDGYWAGNAPALVAELRGEEAALAIPRLQAAIASYPYRDRYRTWPGPNSNTFVAYLARVVPDLRADLPSNALGKDWLPLSTPVAWTPSGTGLQLSFFGLLGLSLAIEEGFEINLLGFTLGIDPLGLALKFPGFGRVGLR